MSRFTRREVLAGMAGLGLLRPRWARASTSDRYLITIAASGAWDPLMLCDPTGVAEHCRFEQEIAEIGGLRTLAWQHEPDLYSLTNAQRDTAHELTDPVAFFTRHARRTRVLNGIQTDTVAHLVGRRMVWSGAARGTHPVLGAMVAAAGPERALAFMSSGGIEDTLGTVPLSRFTSDRSFDAIAKPHYRYSSPMVLDESDALAREALADLHGIQAGAWGPSRAEASIRAWQEAQTLSGALGALERVPLPEGLLPTQHGAKTAAVAHLMISAFQAGLATTGNLSVGGFDTHDGHDTEARVAMGTLLTVVDAVWAMAEHAGIADKLTVMVSSDFGRTPTYNDRDGKNHWPITSALLMGAGIEGGVEVGGTDAERLPLEVGGNVVTPQHLHQALRGEFGISADHPLAVRFPLPVVPIGGLLRG